MLTHSNHLGIHLDGEIHFFTAGKDMAEIIHAECIGGDIDLMVNRRATIGFFPWRFVDGESSIGCCVAMVEDDGYEKRMALKAGRPKTRFGDGYNPSHVETIERLTRWF